MVDENSLYNDRYDHLLQILSSERFLKKQGLGNEVPFFICPYLPKDDTGMKRMVNQLSKQLEQKGVTILRIDLYDLSIELVKDRGIWEKILQREQNISKDELKDLLQGVLDPEKHLIPAITRKMQQKPFDIMFITGAGEVYPYIRTHSVLNNLQSTAKDKPTVIFFPGQYTHSLEGGASLDLFGRLHDDRYYRAFNIYKYE